MTWMFAKLRTWFRTSKKKPFRRSASLAVQILEDRVTPSDFRSVIGADALQASYPYRGTGYSVAVLDTGIDYNDTDLGGGFGAGKRVVAGYDFVNNDADPMDDNGHGTHLAGIIGSSNPNAPGIAPDVHFIALKVLDANMNGSWNAVDSALQWVIANKAKYNIVDVNLSLGSGNYTSNPYPLLENDFSALKNLGVFTAVAAGNRYYTFNSQPGLSYPSVSSKVVSVGATWTDTFPAATFSTGASESNPVADHIVAFTQRSSALSILAPGAWITSDWLDNSMKPMGGTSMATAVVSGAAVLLHQAYDQTGKAASATQDNLLKLMQTTGVSVVDVNYGTDNVAHTGLTFKRLNLKAAMDTIGQPVAPPTFAPIPNQTLPAGTTITVPLNVTSPSGGPITYSWTQVYLPAQAWSLDKQYAFTYMGNYYQNSRGLNEKWMTGTSSIWYAILPNGEVRRWTGSTTDMMSGANLIATLDASYYADPSKLWNAGFAGMPPTVFSIKGNQLSISAPAYWVGTYKVIVSANDGHYTVQQSFNVNEINSVPTLAPIANQTVSHNTDDVVTLNGADVDGNTLTYSAQVLPVNGVAPPIQVTMAGKQLTLHATKPTVGTFTVSAKVSDGQASATQTFTLTLTNTGPTLAAIGPQSLDKGQSSLSVTLSASDADNDALSFQAVAQTPDATLNQLNQLYAFQPANAAYYVNLTGNNEKWLIGKNNTWYAILPNGNLYRWALSIGQTLTPANLVASLDPSVYVEPRLLWNANPPTTPPLTFAFVGSQLAITRPTTLTGVFFIDVTVSDGFQTAKRTIQLTFN